MEHGTFIPLVFSLTGGECHENSMFHKHFAQKYSDTAQKYSEKNEKKYENVFIRCKLSFLILRSVLICVRGSRSVSNDNVVLDDAFLTGQTVGLF